MHDIEKCNFTALVSPALEGDRIFCPIRSVDGKRFRSNLVVMGKLHRPERAGFGMVPKRTHPELGRF